MAIRLSMRNRINFTFYPYLFRYGNGYTHAYGSEGYHHYMRNYDPSYNDFYSEGPSVEDKWRSTYPYVPTSYSYNSIDGEDRPNGRITKFRSWKDVAIMESPSPGISIYVYDGTAENKRNLYHHRV